MAPVIGAGFKMLVPFIVILPGLLALALLPIKLVGESQAQATGGHSYNEVLPLMLARYCGPGLLGLGITALIAGFMSGMAGNVSAFSTVWSYLALMALLLVIQIVAVWGWGVEPRAKPLEVLELAGGTK